MVLNVDHGVFDLIQKKAASICGLDRRVISLGKANPLIVKLEVDALNARGVQKRITACARDFGGKARYFMRAFDALTCMGH